MAIIGTINEISKNIQFNDKIAAGLNYLKDLTSNSFSEITEGESRKISLDGDKVFALNQIYRTKLVDEARFEAHRKYIDLQCVIEGFEVIRNASIADCQPQSDYENKDDVQFFTADFFTPIAMKARMVCILYPEDIHAPGLIFDTPGLVKKSVVKVLI